MIKDILTRTKSTTSQPISQPAEDPSEDLLKRKPATFQQIAETTAKQVGYQPGDEVTGVVLSKQVPNPRLLFISVPDWSEPALCSVQNAADWRPTERIRCVYVKADAQGRLVFENRDGIRRNRWKR